MSLVLCEPFELALADSPFHGRGAVFFWVDIVVLTEVFREFGEGWDSEVVTETC
jgi:hypothetical protein